jgi:hypothetical protein
MSWMDEMIPKKNYQKLETSTKFTCLCDLIKREYLHKNPHKLCGFHTSLCELNGHTRFV